MLQQAHQGNLTEAQKDRLAVLAMLHDLGKANLGFQLKVFDPKAPRAGHIRELAPLFDPECLDEMLHGRLMAVLPSELASWFADDRVAYSYFMAAFSHHGQPLRFKGETGGHYWLARTKWWHPQDSWNPMDAIAEIIRWALKAFPKAFQDHLAPLPSAPLFHHRFAGLLMLADWLGSHSLWFPIQRVTFQERFEQNCQNLSRLLKAVGLDVREFRPLLQTVASFDQRFGFQPRPLQALIDALDPGDVNHQLMIIESETGSGKTEAALDWFFKLFAAGQVDGLYFALPTRVAARELYQRVHRFIERWFPDPKQRPLTVLAVPGYAQVDSIPVEKTLPNASMGQRWQDNPNLGWQERCWAAEHPKRFLAAAVAVGTIDQALLSIVQTAHAHLRAACLNRNLLVIDEVHASDFYMSRLVEVLLTQHLNAGGHALLLSATLGARARHRYLSSHDVLDKSPPPLELAEKAAYPAITLKDGSILPVPLANQAEKKIAFNILPWAFCPEQITDTLSKALSAGARVLVLLNTVNRANALLRSLESQIQSSWLFQCQGVVCPHHGRFAPEDRLLLDAKVSQRFGPKSAAGPILLVGTQTLEQSLDIDADLLVTDLAPVDVLLQRVGRLQRHDRTRPPGYESPSCLLLVPEKKLLSAIDEKGQVIDAYKRLGYGSVYEDLRALEMTIKILEARPTIKIPADNRRLVEAVTHPEKLSSLTEEPWQMHGQWIEGGEVAKAIVASNAAFLYDAYFGDFEFPERVDQKVAARLGMDLLQIPLEKGITSPFGQPLSSVVIPAYMAPKKPEEVVRIEAIQEKQAILRCGERCYRYSQYGLEIA